MTFGLGENFAFLISRQTNKTNKQTVNKQANKHLYYYIIIICGKKIPYIYELPYKNQQAQVVRVHFLKDYVIQVQEVKGSTLALNNIFSNILTKSPDSAS